MSIEEISFQAINGASMGSTIVAKGTALTKRRDVGVRLGWTLAGPTLFAKYATTAALPACTAAGAGVGKTLTATANAALAAQDGQTPAAADVILVKNQVALADNGFYTVTQLGDGSNPFILTRITTADQGTELFRSVRVGVARGTVQASTEWLVDLPGKPAEYVYPTIDTDLIAFGTAASSGKLVRVATAAALSTAVTQAGAGVGATLTNAGAQAALTVDGKALAVGDRVLVQTVTAGMTAANFGVYAVTTVGSGASNWVLTRATDADQVGEVPANTLISAAEGTANAGRQYLQTATLVTMDTTAWVLGAGEPTGTWSVEASANSTDGVNGFWDAITMTIAVQPTATAGSTLLYLVTLPWRYFRLKYVPASGTGLAYAMVYSNQGT